MNVYRSKKAREKIRSTYDALLAQWNAEVVESDVPTAYGRTHILSCGDPLNPPVVLFHGVGDDSALMWLYNAGPLSKRFRVYAVDTIGGPGKSEIGEAYGKDYDDVTWIDDLFNALGLEKASLVGVSHGGYLAQLYTLERPEKVDKAICLASAVPAGSGGSPMKTMMKIFLPEALLPTKGNARKLLVKLSGANSRVFTDNETILEHYTWLLRGFNNMAMRYHKIRSFSDDEISAIRGKAFYLAGLEDPFQKMGGTKETQARDMNARFYKNVGHGINHEIADEINATMLAILEGSLKDLRAPDP